MTVRLHPTSAPAVAALPGQGAASSDRRIMLALLVSLVLHAVVLSVQFRLPERKPQSSNERALEVVLVNARHDRQPTDATLLAQANLDGGGTRDEDALPSTPVPPQQQDKPGNALFDAQQKREQAPVRKDPVLTSPKPAPIQVADPTPSADKPAAAPARPSAQDLLDSAAMAARLEAQIDRSLDEYAKRPRRIHIGSRTREYRFARYIDDWRLKVERIGTLNYPESARGRLHGSLLMTVAIHADGTVEKVVIERSSGQKVLDDAAIEIVKLSAPFAPFPPDISKDGDILEITRTWSFTNADRLTTQ